MVKIYIEETEDIRWPIVKVEHAENKDPWRVVNILLRSEINYMRKAFGIHKEDALTTLFKATADWLKDCGMTKEWLYEVIDAPSIFKKPTAESTNTHCKGGE